MLFWTKAALLLSKTLEEAAASPTPSALTAWCSQRMGPTSVSLGAWEGVGCVESGAAGWEECRVSYEVLYLNGLSSSRKPNSRLPGGNSHSGWLGLAGMEETN